MCRLAFTAIVAIFLLLFATAIGAAPHNGEEFLLVQPDGSLVRTVVWGDEFYQDVESLDGYTLVRDKDGWICYAELSADGSEYVSTGVRYTGKSRAPGARKGLRVHNKSIREKHRRKREVLGYDELVAPLPRPHRRLSKSAAAASDDSTGIPISINPPGGGGGIKLWPPGFTQTLPDDNVRKVVGLTLLIDFPDQKSNVTRAAMEEFCNRKGGYKGTNPAGSAYDYFYDVSNGLLEYTNIVTPFVTVDSNKTYYDRGTDYKYVPELITSALNKLKALNFDLSEITTQTSGSGTNRREVAVALNIFYAGAPTQGWANGIWPHSGTYRAPTGQQAVTINGVSFGRYQLSNLGSASNPAGGDPPGIGTFVHENGHMILRWPDLYSYESPTHSNGVGNWCVMNSGSGNNPVQPNPYLRDLAGWITVGDFTDVTGGGDGSPWTFSDTSNSHSAYLYRRNEHESYYIEARRKTSAAADPRNSALPGSGLAIWHIYTKGDNTTNGGFPMVALVQADGKNDLERKANAGDATDLYRLRANAAFNRATSPAAVYYDGVISNIDISYVSDSGAVMSFKTGGSDGQPKLWYLTVNYGEGGGYYEAGDMAHIGAPEEYGGRYFVRWTSAALEPRDANFQRTYVTMPAAEAAVTANYVKGFDIPGRIEADTGYLSGIAGRSNTANGATGNRVAQITDSARFAEYAVNFLEREDINHDASYRLRYRVLITRNAAAGRFRVIDVRKNIVLDTVDVPAAASTGMQTINGRDVTDYMMYEYIYLKITGPKRAVWRIEPISGNYSIDWFGVEEDGPASAVKGMERAPLAYGLRAAPSGSVSFQVPGAGRVSVKVYDARGRMLAVLCDGVKNAGAYNVKISPRGGAGLSRGFYIVRMESGGYAKAVRLNYSKY